MIEKQISANEFVREAYTVYGKHIVGSGYQEGRMFCDIYDGLKISYRHYIQALWEAPGKMTKVQAILGDAMKKYQFTGDASGADIIYSLANDYKCVETQGNSGTRTMTLTMGGSAPRYVECMLKPQIREQLDRLMPYVPEEITITGFPEKRFIPTALPLALIAGTGSGMGIGVSNNLPAFTADSMLKAYRSQNPYDLRLNYGYSLNTLWDPNIWFDCNSNKPIRQDSNGNWVECEGHEFDEPSDYNKNELAKAWVGQKFKLELFVPLYFTNLNGKVGIVAVVDPKVTGIWKSQTIIEWEQAGYLEVFDISDDIGKMFFSITDGTRKISYDDLLAEIWANCGVIQQQTYHVKISTGIITGRVGLYQWIDFTYQNYTSLYKKYIAGELAKLDYQEAVWTNFEFVAEQLIKYKQDEKSDQQICDECNNDSNMKKIHANNPSLLCTVDIVRSIGQKSINVLRTSKAQEHLDKIRDMKYYFNNMNIDSEIDQFVECWNNL